MVNLNWLFVPTFLLAGVFFIWGVRHWPRLRSSRARKVALLAGFIIAVPGLLYVIYYAHLFDNAQWFYCCRARGFSELAAGGVGYLAGLLYARESQLKIASDSRRFGKVLISAIFAVVLAVPYVKPVIRPLDYATLQERWVDGICMQSTPSTCGPASGATLLKQAGIAATERELAEESYTYAGGTECWYLVRALGRRGLRVRPTIVSTDSQERLYPAIAGTRLVQQGGVGHFVAILGKEEGGYIIGDPMIGRVVLSAEKLEEYYYFTGFYLVPVE